MRPVRGDIKNIMTSIGIEKKNNNRDNEFLVFSFMIENKIETKFLTI